MLRDCPLRRTLVDKPESFAHRWLARLAGNTGVYQEACMIQKEIQILGHRHTICGDPDYLGRMGETFETHTTDLLAALCPRGGSAIDIGANIGMTSLALAQLCDAGSVLAVEPVQSTYALLKCNLETAGAQNVTPINVALGADEGSVSMYVDERNLATAFVVDIGTGYEIPLTSLDRLVEQQTLTRLDFIKIDVEGCELEVLQGARTTLARFQPLVMLEMNHWCLNIFRRISLPEFRERLLELFPCVYAVDAQGWLDFSDPLNAGRIYHAHVFENRYMNLVAGFERDQLLARLACLPPPTAEPSAPQAVSELTNAEERLQAVLASTSWKLTAPLRHLGQWLRRN